MLKNHLWWSIAILLVVAVSCSSSAPTEESEPASGVEAAAEAVAEPTADEKVAELDAMCAGAAEAMAARQAATPLYERLNGRDGIHAVMTDVVRRHQQNDQIKHMMEGVDAAHLVDQVADFLSSATGGDVAYNGRDMVSAHTHLAISNADFLSAGGDIEAAMVAAGVGDDERQEVICAFASLRSQVVTR